ncbi:hypothetical protein BDW22DRAFT_1348134 [Trametopsis cervina]|nr:hypothetical protein BDW22DRAFT_1348134 [Trametopsis cervina]
MVPATVPQAPLHERYIDLPLELVEYIISFLAADDEFTHVSLIHYSLTCRKWRAACIPLLFSCVSVPSCRLTELLALGQLYRSRDFACCIRRLTLDGEEMSSGVFITVLETFSELKHLELYDTHTEYASPRLPPDHPTFELDTLIIKCIHGSCWSLDELVESLRVFTRIDTLIFWDRSSAHSPHFGPLALVNAAPALSLRVHKITGDLPAHVWLRLLHYTRTIEDHTLLDARLRIYHLEAEHVGRLLSTSGANMHSLHMHFWNLPDGHRSDNMTDIVPVGDGLKLSSCRSLTHATFQFPDVVRGNYAALWRFVWDLVSSLSQRTVTSVRFINLHEVIRYDTQTGNEYGLKGLRAALTLLHALKEVVIDVWDSPFPMTEDWAFAVNLLLPRTGAASSYRLVFDQFRPPRGGRLCMHDYNDNWVPQMIRHKPIGLSAISSPGGESGREVSESFSVSASCLNKCVVQ